MSKDTLKQKVAETYVDGKVAGVSAATSRELMNQLIDEVATTEELNDTIGDIDSILTSLRNGSYE